jgi:beta-galactosidase
MKTTCFLSPFIFGALLAAGAAGAAADGPAVGARFTVPSSPRAEYNFNPGWKFALGDAAGADQPAFNDSGWASVSLPHT